MYLIIDWNYICGKFCFQDARVLKEKHSSCRRSNSNERLVNPSCGREEGEGDQASKTWTGILKWYQKVKKRGSRRRSHYLWAWRSLGSWWDIRELCKCGERIQIKKIGGEGSDVWELRNILCYLGMGMKDWDRSFPWGACHGLATSRTKKAAGLGRGREGFWEMFFRGVRRRMRAVGRDRIVACLCGVWIWKV